MNILIVEDNTEKAGEISRAISCIDENIQCNHVSTSAAARVELRKNKYDLLIVDLYLPALLTDGPKADGGFDFLDMLLIDPAVKSPLDVIFITSMEEKIEDARNKAFQRGTVLLEYSKAAQWKDYLSGRIKYIRKIIGVEQVSVDIVIVTALYDPELTAVLSLPYNWVSKRFSGDPIQYHFGKINRNGAELNVVAASARRMGMASASALATRLVDRFSPRCVAMIGICAGIPGKTNLGDIVVADPTWDYGSGKHAVKDDGTPQFLAAPHHSVLDSNLRSFAVELCRDNQVILDIRNGWTADLPPGVLSAYVGPMASGASVIADDEQTRNVVLQQREVLAIEMEAYAVMAAAEYSMQPPPKTLVIKSVCDFADSSKNDKWQKYAAYTAAGFANKLFCHPGIEF